VRPPVAASTPWSGSVLPEPLPKLAPALARRLPAAAYNEAMNVKQHALALAAVLAATVLTGGAAILGLLHRPAPAATPAVPTAIVQQAPAAHSWSEGGD
jgi:hypothetical protein